jgi:hypothetical protein
MKERESRDEGQKGRKTGRCEERNKNNNNSRRSEVKYGKCEV